MIIKYQNQTLMELSTTSEEKMLTKDMLKKAYEISQLSDQNDHDLRIVLQDYLEKKGQTVFHKCKTEINFLRF